MALALALGACKTDLYTKLSEREANEMVALLLDRGIDAARIGVKDGTSTVQVEQTRFAQAVEILKAAGYPQPSFASMGEVFKAGASSPRPRRSGRATSTPSARNSRRPSPASTACSRRGSMWSCRRTTC